MRFFYHNRFGDFLQNVENHYRRLEIVRPSYDERERISPYGLLYETINKNAKDRVESDFAVAIRRVDAVHFERHPVSGGTAAKCDAADSGGGVQYHPWTAAIIKAVLIKNNDKAFQPKPGEAMDKEESWVKLNEQSDYLPYVLGRVFSVLENIQKTANPNLNTTIKDRYFTSACATPGIAFPHFASLGAKPYEVILRDRRGLAIALEKQLIDLMGKIQETFPAH